MKENAEPIAKAASQAEGEAKAAADEAAIPESADSTITVPVKFNKEEKLLSLDEAASLAQKGMKFNLISSDYERLKQLAAKEGHSVTEFLNTLEEHRNTSRRDELMEKCGGDEELVKHILALENASESEKSISGLDELKAQFPEISDISQLPEEVAQASEAKGTSLLDEYLRYRLKNERNAKNTAERQKNAVMASIGSQKEFADSGINPVNAEFIKGLWNK